MTAVPLGEALERRAGADAVRTAVKVWSIVMLGLTLALAATLTLPDRPSVALVALVGVVLIASPALTTAGPTRSRTMRLLFTAASVLGLVVFTSACSSGAGAGAPTPSYPVVLASASFVAVNGSVTWRSTPLLAVPGLYVLTVLTPILLVVIPQGSAYTFDLFTAITAAALFVVILVVRASRRRAQVAFDAVDDIRALVERGAQRSQIESRASALVHDTVLNELAVLATSPPGPLSPNVRRQLEASLGHLRREDWTLPASSRGAPHTALEDLVERCDSWGLEVTVSGDRGLLSGLPAGVVAELLLAVEQCLANVHKHSGETRAEVEVLGSADEVSVMVIDEGHGFIEPADPGDRMGLRASVRSRLDHLGGTAQVWSTPGVGTSVVLTVPTRHIDGIGARPAGADR